MSVAEAGWQFEMPRWSLYRIVAAFVSDRARNIRLVGGAKISLIYGEITRCLEYVVSFDILGVSMTSSELVGKKMPPLGEMISNLATRPVSPSPGLFCHHG